MKKLFLFVAGFCAYSAFAQITPLQTKSPKNGEILRCSHDEHMAQMQQEDPARYSTVNYAPAEPYQSKHKENTEKLTGVVYTIPVVFHVLHNNGAENISDAQILDGLAILNRDWRLMNQDASQAVAAFQGMPTDVEIEFKLATVAPNGACFNGITRTVNAITNNGSDGQQQVNAIIAGNNVYQGVWPHNQYLNIYICGDIGGAAGYTFLPQGSATANATNMYYNGIFVLHDYVGAIGTSSASTSRTLTHESGHWLNLLHVWGSGNTPGGAGNCSQDDSVQDTPNCIGSTTCNLTQNTCNSDDAYWGMAMIDNTENYMDYSYCSKMFTQGQVTRMRAALTSATAGRSNICSTANLQATGAIPGTTLCALDFSGNTLGVCAGSNITFTSNSSSLIATYSWSFAGGTPATSSAASPTVTYNTPGTYQVSLTVTATSNGATYTKTKTSYVVVTAQVAAAALPLTEGFTSTTFPPTGWSLINAGGSTWTRSGTVGVAPTANNSMQFLNYSTNETADDEVRVRPVDLSSFSNAQVSFDVAYRPYSATEYDGLEVLVSTNCGSTFTSLYSKSGTALASVTGYQTSAFTPTAAQWRKDTVDLSAYVGQGNVIIAFRNLSGYGNNLYVDNINVTGTINNAPPVASFTSGGTTACVGQTVAYTSTSTGSPTSYSWSFPGGTPSTSTVANPTVTYSTPGTYNVSLTATNANGPNTVTQNNYITVSAPPATPSITAGGSTTFCQGGSVTLTAPASSSYAWSNGQTTQSINVTSAGNYTVQVANAAGCQSTASAATTVTVNPLPTISFPNLGTVCNYNPAFTLNTASPAGGTYTGTGVNSGIFNPATAGNGTYTLSYSFTNGNGCTNTGQSQIVVSPCLGIDENEEVFNIYPNPTTGILHISTSIEIEKVVVIDAFGRTVYSAQMNQTEIDLSNFASGMYQVQVQTKEGTQVVPVILKK